MPTENKLALKRQRVEHVNQAIRIIGAHGRRFFTHKTNWGGRWRGFSHGGTLRTVVEAFRDYICAGEPLHPGYLGPERFDDSYIWGYDEACMKAVREQAGALHVFRPTVVDAACPSEEKFDQPPTIRSTGAIGNSKAVSAG